MFCAPFFSSFRPLGLSTALTLSSLLPAAQLAAEEATNWAVTTFAGLPALVGGDDGMAGNARFNGPRGVAIDASGQIFVADTFNHTIRKISPGGAVTTLAGVPGTAGFADGNGAGALFNSPAGLAIDSTGILYVADMLNHTVRKITPDGTVSTFAGTAGNPGSTDGVGAAARFQEPVGIGVDHTGNVYVADSGNSVIRKITSSGSVSTLAGTAGESGHDDGVGALARFDGPYGLALDSFDNIYVADTFNHTIRKVTPAGEVSTFAGTAGQSGTADGLSISARFSGPSALAVDPSGSLYVTETANHEIRLISSVGLVSTVAGSAGNDGSSDGVGTISRFNAPYGIAFGPAGNIFVSDTVNNTVRKLTRVQVTPLTPTAPSDSKMINISTRSFVGTGSKVMIAGFIIGGTEPKQVLIRASGPALATFGMPSLLDDPVLQLYSGGTQIAQNDDWASDADRIEATAKRVSAFAWTRGSKDAALVATLPPGAYTAHVTGKNGAAGTALIEAYEADETTTTGKFVNISTRAEVRTGADIMIAGFIIGGTTPKQVLIRASGPALADFGLTGTLADPVLTVTSSQGQLAQNDDWSAGDQTAIDTAVAQTGAFAWKRDSKDAALVLTLPPGAYTALVRGKNETTGLALIEVYEVP